MFLFGCVLLIVLLTKGVNFKKCFVVKENLWVGAS